MVSYLKKFNNLLLALVYSLSASKSLFSLSLVPLSLILEFSLSLLSLSPLSDRLVTVGMGSDWVFSCCSGGGLLIGPWVVVNVVDR